MEKHAVARLIGAPPGYVGYEEGGYLTETRASPAVFGDSSGRGRKGPPGSISIFCCRCLMTAGLTDGHGPDGGFPQHGDRDDGALQPGLGSYPGAPWPGLRGHEISGHGGRRNPFPAGIHITG